MGAETSSAGKILGSLGSDATPGQSIRSALAQFAERLGQVRSERMSLA